MKNKYIIFTIIFLFLNISFSYAKSYEEFIKEMESRPCASTDYKSPCTCETETPVQTLNAFKKKYCEFRKKEGNKKTREQAMNYCADRASDYAKEVREQYYKDCMKTQGY